MDHAPISVEIELDVVGDCIGVNALYNILFDHQINHIKKPRKIHDKMINWESYCLIVDNDFDSCVDKIQNLDSEKSLINMNDALNYLCNYLSNAALTLVYPVELRYFLQDFSECGMGRNSSRRH